MEYILCTVEISPVWTSCILFLKVVIFEGIEGDESDHKSPEQPPQNLDWILNLMLQSDQKLYVLTLQKPKNYKKTPVCHQQMPFMNAGKQTSIFKR